MKEIIIEILSFIILVLASVIDFKTKKIPNMLVLFTLVLYPLSLFFFEFNLSQFIVPTILLVAGVILFGLKIMGGGDAKLLFAFFLLQPASWHLLLLDKLLLSTLFVAGILMVFNLYRGRQDVLNFIKTRQFLFLKSVWGTRFTYAPVILLAYLLLIADSFY